MTDTPALNRPFLKWAGNKFRIVEQVRTLLPAGDRLVEPFAGSGALFLNTDFAQYRLADSNRDLIGLYNILKKDGEAFIRQCRALFTPEHNDETAFYALRDEFNARRHNSRRRAALFLYLNRHGYNGLCRYNRSGEFNVPFGSYARPYFPAREMLFFHHKAQHAEFVHQGFERTMKEAVAGDVIYCDPPYDPLSRTASFTNYAGQGFGRPQQIRLAELADQCAAAGVPVLLSNHDTPFTNDAYGAAHTIQRLQVQRSISCNGKKRETAAELLALFQQSP